MSVKKRQYSYLAASLLGLLLFLLSALGAHHGRLQPWENRIFYDIFDWPNNLRLPFLIMTQWGSALSVAAATLISYAKGYPRLAWRLLLSGTSAYILVTVAKNLIDRPRPYVLLSGIHERELLVSGKGFPSGHTAVATALALTLMPHLPKKWRWLCLVWILMVGLSRLYLGVHAPLDIIGGFGIGLMVAGALHFVVNTDKKLTKSTPKNARA